MTALAEARLIIHASDNGRSNWRPVDPAAVPAWVKEPDNVAHLVAGEMCMKADEGDKGSLWYRAEQLPMLLPGETNALRLAHKQLAQDIRAESH